MAITIGTRLISKGETEIVKVSLAAVLDSAELLTGTPTVTEQTSTDLTLGNKQVNTAQEEIDGTTTAIGKAVLFTVSGQLTGANNPYTVHVQCDSDSTPTRTIIRAVKLKVS